MSKGKDSRKQTRKQPARTMMEKRAAKRTKKDAELTTPIISRDPR